VTAPKDTTVHDGDLWSAYKRIRAHNQRINFGKTRRVRELYDSEANSLKQVKRRNSLKEPSESTWEDLWCLEVDSLDRFGGVSLGLIW
jgi:ribosomal protein S21